MKTTMLVELEQLMRLVNKLDNQLTAIFPPNVTKQL